MCLGQCWAPTKCMFSTYSSLDRISRYPHPARGRPSKRCFSHWWCRKETSGFHSYCCSSEHRLPGDGRQVGHCFTHLCSEINPGQPVEAVLGSLAGPWPSTYHRSCSVTPTPLIKTCRKKLKKKEKVTETNIVIFKHLMENHHYYFFSLKSIGLSVDGGLSCFNVQSFELGFQEIMDVHAQTALST